MQQPGAHRQPRGAQPDLSAVGGVLAGVLLEVQQHLIQKVGVGSEVGSWGDLRRHCQPPLHRLATDGVDERLTDTGDIELSRCEVDLASFDSGEVQEVADDPGEALGVAMDRVDEEWP